ncbi:MAG: hypothetical protein WCP97_07005 [bacterium]
MEKNKATNDPKITAKQIPSKESFPIAKFSDEPDSSNTHNKNNETDNDLEQLSNSWKNKRVSYKTPQIQEKKVLTVAIQASKWSTTLAIVFFLISVVLFFQFQSLNKAIKSLENQNKSLMNDVSSALQTQQDVQLKVQEYATDLNTIRVHVQMSPVELPPTTTPAPDPNQ